ncbi:MAG: helix-turn-helix transcriptional regulator [Firmicutes bacterium]|nr:helix-turn-helix transcriptional regulator [Bacillota bacterium]
MEVYERIKYLRKFHLKLSQAAFGEKLGVNRDVINNIENNRLARPEQKLSLIKLMCKEFNINEEWLLNGTEPMEIQPSNFSLDDFIKENSTSDSEYNILLDIMKAYFDIDANVRKGLVEHFKNQIINSNSYHISKFKNNNADSQITVEEAEARYEEYIKNRSNTAKKTTSSASSTTEENNQESMIDKVVNE